MLHNVRLLQHKSYIALNTGSDMSHFFGLDDFIWQDFFFFMMRFLESSDKAKSSHKLFFLD